MARVLIVSSWAQFPFDVWRHSTEFLLRHSAELDKFGQHSLTEDPAEADIILFAEMGTCGKFAEMVRGHSYYRRYREKCFLFDSGDFFFPIVSGIYASLTRKQYQLGYTRAGFYLYLMENAFITHRPYSGNEKYLASFVGSRKSHPVRDKLFELGREDISTIDTASYSSYTTYFGTPAEREQFWTEYADAMANAKFSLCPRGAGAGSIRLFESMKMGRACVIVSDAWQPNDFVNWSDFSIRVPERDVARVPEILEQNAHRATEMGAHARRAWEEHFSEQARFHQVVELCLDLQRRNGAGGLTSRLRALRQIANPRNVRWYLSSKKDLYRNTGKIYW